MFKKIAARLHLWLGLTAGLVVLISLLAAAVFVWEEELTEWYHHEKLFVKEVKAARLPFHQLLQMARGASIDSSITFVRMENDPRRTIAFGNYQAATQKGWTYASSADDYSLIYVNPYTGEVQGKRDLRYDWIFGTRMLHQCLLLNYDVGHYIVGFATLIILIMVVTGIVLWWPKNKAAFKQRIWFRWKPSTKWRRKNYDVHNIGGIYSFLLIIIFSLTGLVWTFDWWEDTVYRMLGNNPKEVFRKAPPPSVVAAEDTAGAFDVALGDINKRLPHWLSINLSVPVAPYKTPINAFVRYVSGKSGWDESDNYNYHPVTGEMYFATTHDEKTLGAKWRNSNYAIHVGSIYGWPTKVLATLIALFCASLPVTGFYIWWGRRKKGRRLV